MSDKLTIEADVFSLMGHEVFISVPRFNCFVFLIGTLKVFGKDNRHYYFFGLPSYGKEGYSRKTFSVSVFGKQVFFRGNGHLRIFGVKF